MMKILKLLSCVLFLTITVLISCNKEKKEVVPQVVQDTIVADTIDQKNVKLIDLFKTKNKSETIIISSNVESVNKNFILISKYIAIGSKDVLNKRDTVIAVDDHYISVEKKDFEKKNINGEDYVFFSIKEEPMGQFSKNTILNFFMINIKDMYCYNLKFIGNYSLRSASTETFEGYFTSNSRLNRHPVIKKIMFAFATKSRLIYKPSIGEEDIFYYKNYAVKWKNDNKLKDNIANGFQKVPRKIYSTYYQENIIDFTSEISDYDVVIENSNYKIVSFFRNSIIAHDKIKKLHFPIFIESCITGCNKDIEFIAKDKIRITHNEYTGNNYNPEENPDVSEVNLKEIIFKN